MKHATLSRSMLAQQLGCSCGVDVDAAKPALPVKLVDYLQLCVVCRGADAGQVAMLLRAAELGADTFEAFTNSPPYFWTVSGSSRCAVCAWQLGSLQ